MPEPIPPADPTTGTWRLKQIGLAKLLHNLAISDRTGTLVLKRGEVSKSIFFKSGYVMFAESNLATDRLGEVLCRRGEITRAQLSECLAEAKKSGKMLGAVLVEKQVLRAERLLPAIEVQVREIVLGAFAWDDGEYLFSKEFFGNTEDLLDLKIRTSDLIMEGVRRTYSAAQATKVIGNTQLPPKLSAESGYLSQDLTVNFEISKVLSKIDTRRTIAQIVQETALTELAVLQILAALAHLKILDIETPTVAAGSTGAIANAPPPVAPPGGPQDLRVKAARVEEMRAHDEVTQLLDRLPPLVSQLSFDAKAVTPEKISAAGPGAEQIAQSFGGGRRILDVLQERNYTLELVRAVSSLYGAGVLNQVTQSAGPSPAARWTPAPPSATPPSTGGGWQVPKPLERTGTPPAAPATGGMPVGGGMPVAARPAAMPMGGMPVGGGMPTDLKGPPQPISPPPWTGMKAPAAPSPNAAPAPSAAANAGFPATKADPGPSSAGFPASKSEPAGFPASKANGSMPPLAPPPTPNAADAPIPMPPGPASMTPPPPPVAPPGPPTAWGATPPPPLPAGAAGSMIPPFGGAPATAPGGGAWGAPIPPPNNSARPAGPAVWNVPSAPPANGAAAPPVPFAPPPFPPSSPATLAPLPPPATSSAVAPAPPPWGTPQPPVPIDLALISATPLPEPPVPIPEAAPTRSRRGLAFAALGILVVVGSALGAHFSGVIQLPGLPPFGTPTSVAISTPVAPPTTAPAVTAATATETAVAAASPVVSTAPSVAAATPTATVVAIASVAPTSTATVAPTVAPTPKATATPAATATQIAVAPSPVPTPTKKPTPVPDEGAAKAKKAASLAAQAAAELNKAAPDPVRAASLAKQAVALDPKNPDGYFWLGTALITSGDTVNSKKNFETFVKIAPPSHPHYNDAKQILGSL